jgi:hypothetical protein
MDEKLWFVSWVSSNSIVRALAAIFGKRKGEGEPTRRDGLVAVPDYERESNSVIHARGRAALFINHHSLTGCRKLQNHLGPF